MNEDRWTEMDELMLRRTTTGLSAAELERLTELLASAPAEDREWIDRLIGELDAELADRSADAGEGLPTGLRASLLAAAAEAERAIEVESGPSTPAPSAPATPRTTSPVAGSIGTGGRRSSGGPVWAPWVGWAAAAALAVFWFGGRDLPVAPDDAIVAEPDPAAELLATADLPDAMRLEWTGTDDPTAASGVGGEVVWSAAEQRGYMRFTGLQANAPNEYQYQLWIFDAERDERFPVDGGVFDIPPGETEVVVPIDARLPVSEATLFAVTVEPPGGVVVSDRSRIAAVAAAE